MNTTQEMTTQSTDRVALTTPRELFQPENNRITVVVDLPHLRKYGHESTRELVYGCNFPVEIGSLVSCPPTKLYPRRFTGMVVATSGKQYRGPVKHVRKVRA